VKNLITDLLNTYERFDEFKRQLENYHNWVQSEDGQFVHDVFKTSKVSILQELLSARFTKLSAGEKDVQQRVIYQLDQVFDFLMAPMRVVNERNKMRSATYNPRDLMGAGKLNPAKKGKKHGR
jgi:hypothetical protein